MKSKRLLELIEELKKGRVICIKEWALSKNISQRSVQRYIEEIKEFYDVKFYSSKRGCYQILEIEKLEKKLINKNDIEDFEKFSNIIAALNPKFLRFLNIDEKLLKKLVDKNIFYVKESPVEDLINIDNRLFQKLKTAIKYRKIIEIEYISDKAYFFEFKPYKIVFAEGNWYVVGISRDEINNGFKFLRINYIKNIAETNKEFKHKKEVNEFIESFETLFSRFNVPKKEVIVEVDKSKFEYGIDE